MAPAVVVAEMAGRWCRDYDGVCYDGDADGGALKGDFDDSHRPHCSGCGDDDVSCGLRNLKLALDWYYQCPAVRQI